MTVAITDVENDAVETALTEFKQMSTEGAEAPSNVEAVLSVSTVLERAVMDPAQISPAEMSDNATKTLFLTVLRNLAGGGGSTVRMSVEPIGATNGTNVIFTLPDSEKYVNTATQRPAVYRNGIRYFPDSHYTHAESTSGGGYDQIIMASAPAPYSRILLDYIVDGESSGGGGGGSSGMTEAQHKALRQLIHFIDEGPTSGFASGAHKTVEYSPGTSFVSKTIWWTSSGQTNKIVEKTIARNANKTPATVTWQMYSSDGTTVVETAVDTYAYTPGTVNNISITRTIS